MHFILYALCLPAENVYCRRPLPVLRDRKNCVGGFGLIFKMMSFLINDFLSPYLPMIILMEMPCFIMDKSKMMTFLVVLEPMSLLFQQ